MAPTPEEVVTEVVPPIAKPLSGDEVVISGLSGIFPKSDSVLEFMENLYNKVDMVSSGDPRWIFNHPEVPAHLGKVNGMSKFDAQFFRVHYKQACTMEPMSRKLLEHAYSAIYDSGINPLQLRGRKVGVFIGSTFSESEKIVIYETIQRNGFGITGCNKAMYANRISYWIDGKGPSYALDLACASSMACIEHAYRSISTGQCDAAIVGGCNLCMHPNVSLNLKRAGFLCLDGKSKCFDKNGDGYVRSDAMSVLFLQKAKDAKRIYSEVYYAKGSYALKSEAEFMPVRHPKDIEKFLEAFYSEIDVSPQDVEYIEGHGSANAEADGNELQAIGKVFAKDRSIKVGSVVSNMGHSEPASGACALTKVCLAYHKGELPANLHYAEPQDHIPAVKEGKIEVLQHNVPFNRGFAALNSFSYSGANIHVLLKGHYKKKDPERYRSSLPRIVLASGRQEDCVMKIFKYLKNQPVDPEQIGLLHSIHENEIPGHMCRGYILLDTNEKKETVSVAEHIDHFPGKVRPIWFVYSGMGSQWATMGAGLMRIPIFAAAIEKCHRVLEPKGINIVQILTDPDKTIYDNILHSFVGIAAVQIGLTDILREMGIVPDNIIGHSVGELGCAYADGCFTAEEMILSAYSRGLVSVQTPFIRGSMAAVGLGYKTVLPMCPPEIQVACHNSSESSTISGPAEIMKEFVAELTKKSIFAKEVPCSNIAYHSKYIADAGPSLLKYLSEVIKEPKERSSKWVSTSVPQSEWDTPSAKYSSAEYHTNNLLNSVLFEETAKLIPENAIVIEIAPHGLLQAILKRSLATCTHIPLTRRANQDPVKYLLEAVGKLYIAGLNPRVDALYPKIEFPVSTETPLLSHFVGWEHSEDWPEAKYNTKDKVIATSRVFVMSIHDDDYKYLKGHVREGANIFPEAAIIVLVWETLAMYLNVSFKDQSVSFKNIQFHSEAVIHEENPLRLNIMIYKGNNYFEVSCDSVMIATGIVLPTKNTEIKFRQLDQSNSEESVVKVTKDDFYKIMHLRGFDYRDDFRTIQSTNIARTEADIKWSGDWITYLDGFLQFSAFAKDYEGISTPKLIKNLTIDTGKYGESLKNTEYQKISYYNYYGVVRSDGVEFDQIVFDNKPIKEQVPDVLQTQSFIPHFLTGVVNLDTALQINLQVVAENVSEDELIITEMLTTPFSDVSKVIHDVIEASSFETKIDKIHPETIELDALVTKKNSIGETNLFVVDHLLSNEKKMKLFHGILSKNSFVLTFEDNSTNIRAEYKLFHVITTISVQKHVMVLLKKANTQEDNVTYIPITHDQIFSWVPRIQVELQRTRRIVLVSENQPYCGLIGLVRKLKKEYGNKIGIVVVDDLQAPSFHPDNSAYKGQLRKSLTFNILKNGQWGGYYYLPSDTSSKLKHATLTRIVPSDLDSLAWIESPPTAASNMKIQVHYAGLTLKDVEKAVGQSLEDDKNYGMDFSGLNNRGEKVMGFLRSGTTTNTIEADPDLLWPVPEHWTLEDAATVPQAYAHAYYCLMLKSSFKRDFKGKTVFVNGGAGALGQAVISICLAEDCVVYTAVSDIKKKKFLLKLFPEIDENNIGNSRDGSFQDMVKSNTKGKRCDFVINCANGPLRLAAAKCAGWESVFLDISNFDMKNNCELGMFFLHEEKNYVAVDMSSIFRPENAADKKKLQLLVAEGIKKGAVKPLTRIVYAPNDVTRAFRLLSSSKQRGKVLIRLKDFEISNQGLRVLPRMVFSAHESHVVVCDRKGLGIELIDHLVKRGARKIIVNINPNNVGGYFYTKSLSWKKLGVTVEIFNENLQIEKGSVNLLKEASKVGPVQGIFVVLDGDDAVQESFDPKDVYKKFNNTAMVVLNLDQMSRNICKDLRHFVVLSRTTDKITDEYMVSVTEKVCQIRNNIGLPALAFRVGKINEFNNNSKDFQSKSQLLSYSAIFSALETSLKLNYKNARAFNLRQRVDSDFLRKIEKILGIKNINELSENLTLENLSVNEMNMEEIIALIKEKYNIRYHLDQATKLSISNLKSLGKNETHSTKFDSGLGAFYTFIDNDECLATEPMIAMPTKMAIEREEELDRKAEYLMLIPGFEGHFQIFKPICERLKIQAMTFQLGPDLANDSIQQMASNILKFMKKRFELKSKFYLLGYSFGVAVALELAALLEKEGHVGIVFCLDSSPDSLRVQLDAYVGNLSETQLQNAIIEHLYYLMTGKQSAELNNELKTLESMQEKIDACVKKLRGLVNYSNQYKKSLLLAAFKRIVMAREYVPGFKLDSELVLIKGIPHPNAKKLPEDYNLSQYTNKPVKVFNIEADHASAPFDSRVSNIVNKLLDPKLLEEFKKKSLCEFYFADPFKIL